MKSKSSIYTIAAAAAAIILILGVFFMSANKQAENVFEEMYQSVKSPEKTESSFGFMTGIGKLVKTMEADEFYMCAYKTTLNQGEDIFLNIDIKNSRERKTLRLRF